MEYQPRRMDGPGQAEKRVSCEICMTDDSGHQLRSIQRLQSRPNVPRSPALQPFIGGDRSWWTTLTATQLQSR